jgi:hypothetical protein
MHQPEARAKRGRAEISIIAKTKVHLLLLELKRRNDGFSGERL